MSIAGCANIYLQNRNVYKLPDKISDRQRVFVRPTEGSCQTEGKFPPDPWKWDIPFYQWEVSLYKWDISLYKLDVSLYK